MPASNYMVVDPRRDHSIRVPRPDLSVRLGTPNACTQCHSDQSDAWAAAKLSDWYGAPVQGYQDYAEALHAGRSGAPELLIELLGRDEQPAIARATAASLLARYASPQVLQAVSDSLYDPDPLVRLGGLAALEGFQPDVQFRLAQHLLDDPVLAVRIEAGRMLAPVPRDGLDPAQRARLSRAVEDYIASQRVNADRPEAQVNLGNLYTRMGRVEEAEAAYREALALDQTFVPGYTNLADLYRQTGQEADALKALEQGLALAPREASLHHAYGLALVRGKRLEPAVEVLGRAHELAADNARYAYVYAVALDAADQTRTAIRVLEDAHALHQNDAEILSALIGYARKAGETEKADRYEARLVDLHNRSSGARP